MTTTGATLTVRTYLSKKGRTRRYRYWKARIMVDGHARSLGNFPTKRLAAAAYRAAKAKG